VASSLQNSFVSSVTVSSTVTKRPRWAALISLFTWRNLKVLDSGVIEDQTKSFVATWEVLMEKQPSCIHSLVQESTAPVHLLQL